MPSAANRGPKPGQGPVLRQAHRAGGGADDRGGGRAGQPEDDPQHWATTAWPTRAADRAQAGTCRRSRARCSSTAAAVSSATNSATSAAAAASPDAAAAIT